MTSRGLPLTLDKTGVLDGDPKLNPDWHDANQGLLALLLQVKASVLVCVCSVLVSSSRSMHFTNKYSDLFAGDLPATPERGGWHFRGKRIMMYDYHSDYISFACFICLCDCLSSYLRFVARELIKLLLPMGLATSRFVLLTGCSAGGGVSVCKCFAFVRVRVRNVICMQAVLANADFSMRPL